MSDTNRYGVNFARRAETAAPVTVAPALNLRALRITGTPNLAFAPNTITSNEIRTDRQVSDLILVGGEAGGDGAFELSYGAFDDLIESTMLSDFAGPLTKSGTTEITAFAAGEITVDTGSDFQVGHICELRNLATGNVGRGLYRITVITVNDLTVVPHTTDTNAIDGTETAQDLAVVSGTPATELQIVGLQFGVGAATLTVGSGTATLTTTGSEVLTSLIGPGGALSPGQRIKLAGFETAGNNVWARVNTGGATIDFDAPTGAVTEDTDTEEVQIYFGDTVRNGAGSIITYRNIVEQVFQDHLNVGGDSRPSRALFFGMNVNQLNVQLQPQAIATASATFFGLSNATAQDSDGSGTNALFGGTVNRLASAANDVYNTSSNVGRIGRGTDPIAAAGRNFVLEATIAMNNNLRRQNAVGVFGAAGIGLGELSVTGTLNTYFDSLELLDQVVNNTESSLDITLRGNDGRALAFDMPRIKFSGGAPDVPGKNQDVVINLTYQAILSTFGFTISVTRFPYAA